MGAPAELTSATVCTAMTRYRDALRSHQEVINRLNVYPVPDGDTGTNMMLTVDAVVQELAALDPGAPMADVCKAVAHGSLMGARGNSGVILSQLLRGVSDRFSAVPKVEGSDVATALVEAAALARKAVVRPVEGTILTVSRAAGEGAEAGCVEGAGLCQIVESARQAAKRALDLTPTMLPALAQAGVVDAGGAGYLLMLDALLSAIDGRDLPTPPPIDSVPPLRSPTVPFEYGVDVDGEFGDATGLRYEVMYFLNAPDDTIPDFKEVWAGIGDSIVVVGGDGTWNCHIHTDDIGAAIEAALDCGRPRNIRITDLAEQVLEERWVREHAGNGASDQRVGPAPTTDVVAVVTGEGIGRIFRSLGVHHLVPGGQSMNPSTAEILDVVERISSDQVVILPNNKNIRPVAERVDELSAKTIRVVPTESIVQGFAALLAYDPAADAERNVETMTVSASRVEAGEVTRAVRAANTGAGPVEEGDWIGLSRDGVVSVADSPAGAARGLLARIVDDHELVTVIEGEEASAPETRRITEWLHDEHPDVAVEVHQGGQPLYPYLFGVE
jgi:DAK2 domain fusion protein YloV